MLNKAMVQSGICGHIRQIKYLEQLAGRGMPMHAFIFSGPESVGKKTIALRMFAGLMCKTGGSAKISGCGECNDCSSVLAFRHPDVHFVEKSKDEKYISIAQVREMKRRLALSSYSTAYKGVIIDNAHLLGNEAQAALLKILEEPSAGTVFFLITHRPEVIFETVRSRTTFMNFGLVSDHDIYSWLKGTLAEKRFDEDLVAISGGRPGIAKIFVKDQRVFSKERQRVIRFKTFMKSALHHQFSFVDSVLEDGEEEAENFLGFLIAESRSRALGNIGNHEVRDNERLKTMLNLYNNLTLSSANRRLILDSAVLQSQGL